MSQILARVLGLVLLSAVVVLPGPVLLGSASAQERSTDPDPRSEKVKAFVKLLDDPDVRAWLATAPAEPATPTTSVAADLATWDDALRAHLVAMAEAFRRLPAELASAVQHVSQQGDGRGLGALVLLLVAMAAVGYAAEWLTRRGLSDRRPSNTDAATSDPGMLTVSRLVPVLAFTAGSIVAFLAIGGPPLVRKVALTYLVAFIAVRAVTALSDLCAGVIRAADRTKLEKHHDPPADESRFIAFWQRRVVVFAAYLMVAWATLTLLPAVGFSEDATQLVAYLAGIGLVVISIESVWRAPAENGSSSTARKWLLSIFLVLLWCVWSVGLNIAFWVGVYLLVLPKALSLAGKVAASTLEREKSKDSATSVRDALIVGGARAVVVLLAVLWLGFVLRINPGVLAGQDSFGSQVVRGLLRSAIILVVADLIWQFAKAYIDGMLVQTGDEATGAAEAARRSRVRTLLPIFRNALAVLVATVAALMVLSEMGVQIGPLIAGASIFGVAIGFGSQTLVKDIVSGIFYLMDDAFRVGEYIQSGSYKGTVESFSLRSVRLRHHRGPVFTVPFGELGAVQNMSRDWAIDKFMICVPFDTDIKLVRKLTKAVGAALLEDPDLGPDILETVKMKGVEQIGDYGIDISFAMMTKPGHQTSVRRRAYSMIRDAFAANGIEFARPSVYVGGDEDHSAAAAEFARKADRDKQSQATG